MMAWTRVMAVKGVPMGRVPGILHVASPKFAAGWDGCEKKRSHDHRYLG